MSSSEENVVVSLMALEVFRLGAVGCGREFEEHSLLLVLVQNIFRREISSYRNVESIEIGRHK